MKTHLQLMLFLLLGGTTSASPYMSYMHPRIFQQPLDHFSFPRPGQTFSQRVLVNYTHCNGVDHAPIFFYFGNEADVSLYVTHTGLMWENAPQFKACVIFAEHRGYGQSLLRTSPTSPCSLNTLTTEQAMRDFAVVIAHLRRERDPSAVIGFGGSYGGMLATWMKFKYPHLVDGVIAGSAPVLGYLGMDPPYDPTSFARLVTKDAGPECAAKVKSGFETMYRIAKLGNPTELADLSKTFHTCSVIKTTSEALHLLDYAQDHWNYLAMGSFPYPSSYVTPDGNGMLPAWPMKVACDMVLDSAKNGYPVRGVALAANMFYNSSKKEKCLFNGGGTVSSSSSSRLLRLNTQMNKQYVAKSSSSSLDECKGDWQWQYCTQHVLPVTQGTAKDMFFPLVEFNLDQMKAGCQAQYGAGLAPVVEWSAIEHGGLAGFKRTLRNVVFSNGLLDPWSTGGVLDGAGFHPSVKVLLIPLGAHHVDLMFNHKHDVPQFREIRKLEVQEMHKWVEEGKKKKKALLMMTNDDNEQQQQQWLVMDA